MPNDLPGLWKGENKRLTGSAEECASARRRTIALLKAGHAPVEVAQKVGVGRRSVRRWNAAYRQHGEAGIRARPTPGRPSKLDADERALVQQLLLEGAEAAGFESDLWTSARVAQLIEERLGVKYHRGHMGRLLRSLGYTPQRPPRGARERDDGRIQAWVPVDRPRRKPRGGRRGSRVARKARS